MKVAVIGAGLAGLTAALALAEAGVEVTVLERRDGPGRETSARNGSLQHPSHVEPWNAPGIWRTLLANLGREDGAMLLRLSALPGLIGWGLHFLRCATAPRHRAGTLANLRLAQLSLAEMARRREQGLRYHRHPAGTLTLMRDAATLDAALPWARELAAAGLDFEVLDRAAVLAHEPALAGCTASFAGALRYPGDERGDPAAFCDALHEALVARGAQLRYGTVVQRLQAAATVGHAPTVCLADGQTLAADAVVLAAASASVALARPLGLALPVRPVKGYSITAPRRADDPAAPRHAVIDPVLHVAAVPVGDDRLRVAGTAEFAGFDLSPNPVRTALLERALATLYPALAAALPPGAVQPWCGLRPMCSDGLCLVGATRVSGLWLHTGHGQLGFTVAAGSARLLASAMTGAAAPIDPAPYAPARFGL